MSVKSHYEFVIEANCYWKEKLLKHLFFKVFETIGFQTFERFGKQMRGFRNS